VAVRVLLFAVVVSSGCALGPVRRVHVAPLQPYASVRTVRPDLGPGVRPLEQTLAEAVGNGLQRGGGAVTSPAPGGFRVRVTVLEAVAPTERGAGPDVLGSAATLLGLSGAAGASGRLRFEAFLLPPEGEGTLGSVLWEGTGDPERLASTAGAQAGEALAKQLEVRRFERFPRRAGDERLFLIPTAQTLPPGAIFVSDDEVLLLRAGAGLGRRVQLDVWLGGFGVPVAGGFALPAVHLLAAGGGAGLGVVGVADLGLKVRLLDEGEQVPGVAVSYDMLNLFGAVFGGGALVIGGGGGAAVAAAAGVAAANLQFNVFALTVQKHLGPVELVAGAYVVDNHHWVGQSATVAVGVGATSGTAGFGDTANGSTEVPMVPTQWQPYLGAKWVLGPHSALAAELLPRIPVSETMFTTGVRWLLGYREPAGPWARDRIRLKVDLAAIWVVTPKTSSGKGGFLAPLPWVGLGVYVL